MESVHNSETLNYYPTTRDTYRKIVTFTVRNSGMKKNIHNGIVTLERLHMEVSPKRGEVTGGRRKLLEE
jgi:hypothetical protein